MDTAERWVDIPGWEGIYQVSSCGRIKSLPRVVVKNNGVHLPLAGVLLHPSLDTRKRFQVCLHRVNPDRFKKHFLVHRLVAMAFIPNRQNKPEVNHLSGNYQDNNVANLAWATEVENRDHAVRMEIHGSGGRATRYIVRCCEYGITTLGVGRMLRELKLLGIHTPKRRGILACLFGHQNRHRNLSFKMVRTDDLRSLNAASFMDKLGIS